MTQEEKAKAYDEALERAKNAANNGYISQNFVSDIFFPELAESGDERIKNFISNELACLRAADEKGTVRYNELTEAIAWLDISSEENHANKVKPKFKIGDWVVSPNGVYWHIDKISNNRYEVTSNTEESSSWNLDTNIYHKFTIKDAKPGDVLYDGINACIFRKKMEDDDAIWVDAYCGINIDNEFKVNDEYECWCLSEDCSPATKEQREQLEKAMSDAGYTFDFDKKELKKIEQNPAWSEEDEKTINELCNVIAANAKNGYLGGYYAPNLVEKIKSLRSRNTWKPSDEQMKALKEACDEHWEPDGLDPLYTLYQDLKKLKEE